MGNRRRVTIVIVAAIAIGAATSTLTACGNDDPKPEGRQEAPSEARTNAMFERARVHMRVFDQAIQLHYLHNRSLPESLDALAEGDPMTGEPFMESIPNDPWGNPYAYRRLDGRNFWIQCFGPDGVRETDDDLIWPERDW